MTCPDCGAEMVVGSWPFCKDGHAPASKLFNVIGDEIVGGFVQEHFGVQPETFYYKSDMARRAKELGLVPMVRHVGEQGSDKSSKTSRWTAVPLDEATRIRQWHEHEAQLQWGVIA